MHTPEPTERKDTIIRIRIDSNTHDKLRLAAESETAGNISDFVRRAAVEKIERKLGRAA